MCDFFEDEDGAFDIGGDRFEADFEEQLRPRMPADDVVDKSKSADHLFLHSASSDGAFDSSGDLFEADFEEQPRLPMLENHMAQGQAPNHIPGVDLSADRLAKMIPNVTKVHGMFGIGSSCAVYCCSMRIKGEDTEVAVKVLHREVDHEREHMLKGMKHPNLVEFYDLIKVASFRAHILEPCSGGSLQALLRSRQLQGAARSLVGPAARAQAALDVLQAVSYLHSHKVIHRDVKVSNCLLSKEADLRDGVIPMVKLGGLGRVRMVVARGVHMTRWVGPVSYTAPEMVTSSSYAFEADVFSCAMLLHETMTGLVPYSDCAEGVLTAIMIGKRPSLDALPEGPIGFAVGELLEQCWGANPADRITAREAASDLQELLEA